MTSRRRLPNRRAHDLIETEFRGAPYSIGVGRFHGNEPAEVFIDCQARGLTPISDDARDAAVCLSLALQYGCPIHVIRGAVLRYANGEAATIIGHAADLLEGSE